jgi:flagellar hook protein FlgE
VAVDQAKSVTATFGLRFRQLTTSVAGKGKIVSSPAGIACPSTCTGQFDVDSTISLRAVPAKGYKLSGWTGACKGRAACSVTLSDNATVRATFKRR